MKIISLVGARPQFIKYAPIGKKLKKEFDEILVHSGQHYDEKLSDLFFRQMGIPEPDVYLNVGSHSHGKQTAILLESFENILLKQQPDLVLVVGDTNTTLSGALAARKLNIKLAHIEAGLRSENKSMPEEINRIITDHCSDFLFCPTENAVQNLHLENINKSVYNTGDIMLDAFLENSRLADNNKIINDLNLFENEYFLCTVHRAENTDSLENLKNIFNALKLIGKTIVFPIHPRTQKVLKKNNIAVGSNIKLIDPVGYLEMLALLQNCRKVLTDSGGLQKEAFFAQKFCKTLRTETEWGETLINDQNVICGADTSKIVGESLKIEKQFEGDNKPFGDGTTSNQILKILSTI